MTDRRFTHDWVTHREHVWKDWLGHLIDSPNVTGLELGVYEGRSAAWWCENILTGVGSQLTCVDIWHNQNDRYQQAKDNLSGLPCTIHRTSTRWILANLLIERKSFDFAYVDADHGAHSVLADMCGAWQILKPEGIMICDDYGWTNRKRPIPPNVAIDAWLDCYRNEISGYEVIKGQCSIWKK